MMGVPIPFSSLGTIVPEMMRGAARPGNETSDELVLLYSLYVNALQVR
jgi:hypothetical protein